ncbi:DUF2624 domain-containing protein [Bacillus marinisedimentorum]|uniref:DUF2624 domain-containing protein n=1 Tax=Bacillus marinisedimentorum TaxID=1821260 RepID=UPI0008721412|nr:DUF2624 domain-containing protein [Bacillus marinisedimentorum]
MNLFQSVVNQKLNTLDAEELLKYAALYKLNISKKEAQQIAAMMNGKNINIFNDSERKKLLQKIARQVNPELAKELHHLFKQFMKL